MESSPRAGQSLAGRMLAAIAAIALLAVGIALAVAQLTESWLLAGALALLTALPLGAWLARRLSTRWSQSVLAVADGVTSLKDHDFSISVTAGGNDEIGRLTAEYNTLGERLRRERLDLHQRELLLDTVVQTTPLALVLTNPDDAIVFGNIAARQLFNAGRRIEGAAFGSLLASAPESMREAVDGDADTLFTVEGGGEAEIFHLTVRHFTLNGQPHRLLMFKQLTRELAAQEVATWKKVIRVIAHELNNSLAPISSLAHSGRALAQSPDPERLAKVFGTIEERATHLAGFIDGYSRFAKLPKPRPAEVSWRALIEGLRESLDFRIREPLPEQAAWLDATQIEQVLINLLKNAAESGSPADGIVLGVTRRPGGWMVEVEDQGDGLDEAVLRDALLPFYSTKDKGTGLGLTLCREIVEAHGGRLRLANRRDGGARVSVWLPDRPAG